MMVQNQSPSFIGPQILHFVVLVNILCAVDGRGTPTMSYIIKQFCIDVTVKNLNQVTFSKDKRHKHTKGQ